MNLIDIHTHILPGLDDGAKTQEESLQVITEMIRQGIKEVIVTPHHRSGMFRATGEQMKKAFVSLQNAVQKESLDIKLYLGCEYHKEVGMLERLNEKVFPTMAGGNYILLEYSHVDTAEKMERQCLELLNYGWRPILAHIERFPLLYRNWDEMEHLQEIGVAFQINADSICGKEGLATKRLCKKLLQEEMVQFIASDVHNLKARPCRLEQAADYVEKKFDHDLVQELFYENPRKVILNESL